MQPRSFFGGASQAERRGFPAVRASSPNNDARSAVFHLSINLSFSFQTDDDGARPAGAVFHGRSIPARASSGPGPPGNGQCTRARGVRSRAEVRPLSVLDSADRSDDKLIDEESYRIVIGRVLI